MPVWSWSGHSERRQLHGETDAVVAAKAAAALDGGLTPIVCRRRNARRARRRADAWPWLAGSSTRWRRCWARALALVAWPTSRSGRSVRAHGDAGGSAGGACVAAAEAGGGGCRGRVACCTAAASRPPMPRNCSRCRTSMADWSAARRSTRMNFWRLRVPEIGRAARPERTTMAMIGNSTCSSCRSWWRSRCAGSSCCSMARAPTWARHSAADRRAASSAPPARPISCRARRRSSRRCFSCRASGLTYLGTTQREDGSHAARRDAGRRRRPKAGRRHGARARRAGPRRLTRRAAGVDIEGGRRTEIARTEATGIVAAQRSECRHRILRTIPERRRGEIGRHAVLRGQWRKPWEFESPRRHHRSQSAPGGSTSRGNEVRGGADGSVPCAVNARSGCLAGAIDAGTVFPDPPLHHRRPGARPAAALRRRAPRRPTVPMRPSCRRTNAASRRSRTRG